MMIKSVLYRRAGLLWALALIGCGAVTPSDTALPTIIAANVCANASQPLDQPIIVGADLDLWMLNAAGANPTQITTLQPGTVVGSAAWSPDRTTLAYSLNLPPSDPLLPWQQAGIICGFNAATGQGRTLARGSLNDGLSEPSWAADSQAIVVTRRRINLNEKQQFQSEEIALVRYDLASGAEQVLVKDAIAPALSPDGARLVYVNPNLQSGFPSLMIANSDGSKPQPLVPAEQGFTSIAMPRWAPDGSQLVFSARGGPGSTEGGRQPVKRSWWARWLGAGTAAAHGEPGALWVVQPDGQQLRPLIADADDPLATWDPAGNTLLYADWSSGLVRYDPASGSAESLGLPAQYWLLEWAGH